MDLKVQFIFLSFLAFSEHIECTGICKFARMYPTNILQRESQRCDIDECAEGTYNCSSNSFCENTLGSYKCSCEDGYHRNGSHCEDLDECTEGTYNCSSNSYCVNTLGSYKCKCDKDYYRNELHCKIKPFRGDLRCGPGFIAPNGKVAICRKDGYLHCCSSSGWCGRSDAHCNCNGCINYRQL